MTILDDKRIKKLAVKYTAVFIYTGMIINIAWMSPVYVEMHCSRYPYTDK
jgi:hypothetical protein